MPAKAPRPGPRKLVTGLALHRKTL